MLQPWVESRVAFVWSSQPTLSWMTRSVNVYCIGHYGKVKKVICFTVDQLMVHPPTRVAENLAFSWTYTRYSGADPSYSIYTNATSRHAQTLQRSPTAPPYDVSVPSLQAPLYTHRRIPASSRRNQAQCRASRIHTRGGTLARRLDSLHVRCLSQRSHGPAREADSREGTGTQYERSSGAAAAAQCHDRIDRSSSEYRPPASPT